MAALPYVPAETGLPAGTAYQLTPPEPEAPRINGPKVYGARPGNPVLYTVPATGNRPLVFEATGLPAGLTLDAHSGRITGEAPGPGKYPVRLRVRNDRGTAERVWTLVVGATLALTPPMGWNSWNCWSHNVNEETVRASALALVTSGLVQHGWSYVNIDDSWQGVRGGPRNALEPNGKFPDLKALCDDVHNLGLKIGIYSTPWVTTYAGFNGGSSDHPDGRWSKLEGWDRYRVNHRVGAHRFEEADAAQFARWGFDYLKYDWFPNDPECAAAMGRALAASGRDIVYSLSNSAPRELAEVWKAHAHCWRTTNDIRDSWSKADLLPDDHWFLGLTEIAALHEAWAPYSGPGHWNDADMLVVGTLGWGTLRENRLTPDEQYTHLSLWCLWSSPLLLGCPVDRMDEFTRNLLTNDEVLEVNQDVLGRQAVRVPVENGDVWVKELEDGSVAAGFVNTGTETALLSAGAEVLGQAGPYLVRDLWRQQDVGLVSGAFSCRVRPHGVVLVKVRSAGDPGPKSPLASSGR